MARFAEPRDRYVILARDPRELAPIYVNGEGRNKILELHPPTTYKENAMLSKEIINVIDNTVLVLPDAMIKEFTNKLSRIHDTSETPEELESRLLQHCYQSRMDADTPQRKSL